MKKKLEPKQNAQLTATQPTQTQFINLIFKTNFNTDKPRITNKLLEKYFLQYKQSYFPIFYRNILYITKKANVNITNNTTNKNNINNITNININNNNYNSSLLKNKECYLNILLYSILFLLEEKKESPEGQTKKIQKKILLKHFLTILEKLYKEKKILDSDILTLLKFIVFLSIYERKDFVNCMGDETGKNPFLLKIIKNYKIFAFSIDIVIKLNQNEITNEYLDFIDKNIIEHRTNLFIITKRVDMLKLVNLSDDKNGVIDFLGKIYAFKYSKEFLDFFIQKINEIYDIKNKDKKTINILNYLKNYVILLSKMQRIEKNIIMEDPYLLSNGFVMNNNINSKIFLKDITIKEKFTIIFSFNYSPEKTNNNNNKTKNNKKSNSEIIPIIDSLKEQEKSKEITGFSFFIKNNILYHRKYNSKDEIKLCNIIENKTYVCCFSIKEKTEFSINVKSKEENFEKKEKFKSQIKTKLNLMVGRFFKFPSVCFTGYIGPLMLFNCSFSPEYKPLILGLKGSYEKSLFFWDYNYKFMEKYDKDINFPLFNDQKDKNNNFNDLRKIIEINKLNVDENLICFLRPNYEGASLKKTEYTNKELRECTLCFGAPPIFEENAVFFFRNNFTPYEFLKYEGINFLIFIFELIVSNIDNIGKGNENDRIIILNLFSELIPYIQELIFIVNVNNYEKEIKRILFALEKCIYKMCKKFKMCSEIIHQLNNWIRFLTKEESPYSQNFAKIRNEICKFLLNTELYDKNEFFCIESFFSALNYSIEKRPDGLINMEFLLKIISFTDIFKLVTKQKNIRKTRQFKTFKTVMINVLINFLKSSEYINPYMRIYHIFSDNTIYDFRKYQFVKIFYLQSRYYYDKINEKEYLSTWKYFLTLFKYLQSCETFTDITEKQAQILMTISLRLIMEYPLVGNFFKENKYVKKSIVLKKKQKSNKTICEKSALSLNKIIWSKHSLSKSDSESESEQDSDDFRRKINKRNSAVFQNKILKKTNFNMFNVVLFRFKRSKSPIPKIKEKYNYNNLILEFSKTEKQIDLDEINQINYLDQNSDFFGYVDFFTYKTLMDVLEKNYKLNDFIFRALLLFILENNNNVTISQDLKLKFITKVEKFEDLKNEEFSQFLKFSYINRETNTQLIKLVNIVKKNYKNITHITYDIFLYLIIHTCEKRVQNRCTFNHLIKSNKICKEIFITALKNDKEAYNLILQQYSYLIILTLPYHKQSFVSEFLYDIVTVKNKFLMDSGQILINMLLLVNTYDVNDKECLYLIKINSIILLYRIIKTEGFFQYVDHLMLKENGLYELFDFELVTTKVNIFKDRPKVNKKKCYAEVMFEIMLYLCIYSNKFNYYQLIYQMFIMNIMKFKVTNNNSKSILYFIDEIKGQGDKKNKALKIFKKPETIELPCLSLQFLLKALKYRYKCQNEETKILFGALLSAFYNDSYFLFKNHNSKQKKYKNKVMYNFLREHIKTKASQKKPFEADAELPELIKLFDAQYSELLKKKKKDPIKIISKNSINEENEKIPELLNTDNDLKDLNFISSDKEDNLNNSFESCKSVKEVKNICYANQKKVCKTVNIRQNFIKIKYKKKQDPFDVDEDDDNMCNPNSLVMQTNVPISKQDFRKGEKDKEKDKDKDKEKDNNLLFNINNGKNPFNLDIIGNKNRVVLFPKSYLIEQIFGVFFVDKLFYNWPFIKMKQYFKYYIKKHYNINKEINANDNNSFNYPIIMKNYISNNLYYGDLFLKHDLDFFKDRYFNISHPYFKEKAKECIQKRIFKKISEQDDINQFLNFKSAENKYEFYVDLVTNRNVVFGKLTIYKQLLYFENIDKNKFLKQKTDTEKIDYLLCSQECDYYPRNKKLYMFKKEIIEIINRRFLYSFQACEIYLKNGKSYFFNFYSETKKIEFVSIMSEQANNVKIIRDLKTEFRNKGFTKKWLNNQISTLAYLLFVNKYSCRSYNDVNQYPIFPWLIIYGDKERDLKYTITAQDEDARMMLREKYPFSSQHFPYHYTTHYSNASFLIYYLIRINPFTDNQITLQVNKFDVPGRQFHSLDEIQRILYSTKQPREVIPEFFMSTEFFYNYNCNFFGAKNNSQTLINDLINKNNFSTPLEYISNNEVLLESPKFKSQINFFIDNIFGTGQMGGCERCNTYDKYSYQEMVDLNEKIKKFKEKKLKYEEIKLKIVRKSSKIISFGQTPFKLFEDIHPQWKPDKGSKEEDLKIYNNFEDKKKFLYFDFDISINGKQIFYILFNNNENNFTEIYFYDKQLKEVKEEKKLKEIKTQKRVKLCSKIHIDNLIGKSNNFMKIFKYNPKFMMVNINFVLFIFGRLREGCFCVFNKIGESKSYLVESIIITIAKSFGNNFFAGLENGKILEFKLTNFDPSYNNGIIDLNNLQIDLERSFLAHKKRVSCIYYSDLLELIISSGNDQKIFIRKYYDLSLLTVINIGNQFCIDIKIRLNYLYILLYDNDKQANTVQIRSINGIIMAQSKYDIYNNIDFDKDGNLLIGLSTERKIEVYNPALTKTIKVIDLKDLNFESKITKKKEEKEKGKEDIDIYFMDFKYQKENSSIYCYFSNGFVIQKYLESNSSGS